jgi:hypothetical protein
MCVSKFVHLLFCQYNVVHRGGISPRTGQQALSPPHPAGRSALPPPYLIKLVSVCVSRQPGRDRE